MIFLRSIYYWTIGLGYIGPVLLITLIRSYFQTPTSYDPWLRKRLQTLFRLLDSEPTIEFSEPLPDDKPLIFMANHSSLIDIPLLKAVIPHYFMGIIAHDQLHYPLYGKVVQRMGNIPIYRDNVRKSLRSFEEAKQRLEDGIHITVLPEGNRSLDGKLLPFKKLPFHFAEQCGAHIVPIAISGVFNMKNKHSIHLTPGNIVVRFGPIIDPNQVSEMDAQTLLEITRERIYSGLEAFESGEDNHE
ncbi:MAG: 1-acyl-sn-glycerol-3-phosphate acyltransferase [Candidatus Marinimicrobia bacterium]|nr:1-acyl-sn-glycerol-3-phosphate acyltransferase [Candidatus Neomarinimicrobiota bacterium]MCF7851365.1 1-acyl-sn-glycerol-3-phosphate acyltransferase [Candidatus Neomarinimicrobiota bacterium]MCF7904199.1 1-acyl-sn-glycerol-3-phosphate acyltransferase [Candidatus Neomarinimicrobiota bacterium]